MKYFSSTIERDITKLPEGFDMADVDQTTRDVGTVNKRKVTFAVVPCEIGVFEGTETPVELDKVARTVFGETTRRDYKDDDGNVIVPKGTAVNFTIGSNIAWRLHFQKAAVDARTPEGLGRLTGEQYAAIGEMLMEKDQALYTKQLIEVAKGNLDEFKRFLLQWWKDAGQPALPNGD